MPTITLVRSAHADSARDAESGVVIRVGQTLDVPTDVATRLLSTEALGDEYEVTYDPEPEPLPDHQESATPAPVEADAPSAPEAQE